MIKNFFEIILMKEKDPALDPDKLLFERNGLSQRDYSPCPIMGKNLEDFDLALAASIDPNVQAMYEVHKPVSDHGPGIDCALISYFSGYIPKPSFTNEWLEMAARTLLKKPTDKSVRKFVAKHRDSRYTTPDEVKELYYLCIASRTQSFSPLVKKLKLKNSGSYLQLCAIDPDLLTFDIFFDRDLSNESIQKINEWKIWNEGKKLKIIFGAV